MLSALLFLFPLNAHHADERPLTVVDLPYSQPQLQQSVIGSCQLRRTVEADTSINQLSALPSSIG
jgi:hypothetical protein